MSYGIANKKGRLDREEALKILGSAFSDGITGFDTSSLYGESEEVIGSFIAGLGTGKNLPCVVSKLPGLKNVDVKDIDRTVRAHLAVSMKRLNIGTMLVYLLHDASDMYLEGGAVIESLTELKKEGRIGKLGVSIYHPAEAEKVLEISELEVVQLPVSLFDQRFIKSGLLEKLHDNGKTVMARSIFLQGLFFLGEKDLPKGLAQARPYLEKLNEVSKRSGKTIAELAMGFIKSLGGIDSIVVGAESVAQVKKNIELWKSSSMDDELKKELIELFGDVPEEIVLPYLWSKNK